MVIFEAFSQVHFWSVPVYQLVSGSHQTSLPCLSTERRSSPSMPWGQQKRLWAWHQRGWNRISSPLVVSLKTCSLWTFCLGASIFLSPNLSYEQAVVLVDFDRDIFPLPLFRCEKFQVWKIAYENPSLFTSSSPEVDFTFPKTTSVEKRLKDSCFSFDINTDLSQMGKKGKQKVKGNIMNSSKRKWFSGWPSKFPCEVNLLFWKPPNKTENYLSHEQKPFYFPLYCLFKNGILIMVHENPRITGSYFIPYIPWTTRHPFFIAHFMELNREPTEWSQIKPKSGFRLELRASWPGIFPMKVLMQNSPTKNKLSKNSTVHHFLKRCSQKRALYICLCFRWRWKHHT